MLIFNVHKLFFGYLKTVTCALSHNAWKQKYELFYCAELRVCDMG